MTCFHQNSYKTAREVKTSKGWVKASVYTQCSKCDGVLLIATYPGAFMIHDMSKLETRWVRIDDEVSDGQAEHSKTSAATD